MKPRILMAASAVFLGVLGLLATFLPQEILARAGTTAARDAVLLVQALGGLYLGFAMLNWMARGILIGGIYARPVALGNFLHFAVVAVALIKALVVGEPTAALAVVTALYTVFALWFGAVLFGGSPGRAPTSD